VPSDIKGYCAVCVNGITLGFGKASNGRLKNKYPKGLRTLK
jgi:NOL1/NOP2/fmu family ribosome biogenesis protein